MRYLVAFITQWLQRLFLRNIREMSIFKGGMPDVGLTVGLTDKEALWLGTRHNATASFRHEIKLKEEVCHSHVQKMFIQRSNTLRERAVTKDFMRSDWLLERV